MGYKVPTFNLTCNIGESGSLPLTRLEGEPCQLTYGRRVNSSGNRDPGSIPSRMTMHILLPKGTDVRGPQDTTVYDWIECPAGTGRIYEVIGVDDIGKGFSNEHRTAEVQAVDGMWLAPYP